MPSGLKLAAENDAFQLGDAINEGLMGAADQVGAELSSGCRQRPVHSLRRGEAASGRRR